MSGFFAQGLEFLKGIGPQKAALIQKELKLRTVGDLIQFFPFRYEDRTTFYPISALNEHLPHVQVKGRLESLTLVGIGSKQRLVGKVSDGDGELELVWFKGSAWVRKNLLLGKDYVVFGKPTRYGRKLNMAHPEMEVVSPDALTRGFLQPVYHTTEKLKRHYIDARLFIRALRSVLPEAAAYIEENLPVSILHQYRFISRNEAFYGIHFPADTRVLQEAQRRLKFEELFFVQLKILKQKQLDQSAQPGIVLDRPDWLNKFYEEHLPFELTDAQKRVIKEIYTDLKSGVQMNRLVQGDVGSGKTIVAFMSMLIAMGSGSQCAFMAPTEILAEQHFKNLRQLCEPMGIRLALLTGSTKAADRKLMLDYLKAGDLHLIVGTHALLEDRVKFKQLGLAVIDEQHRFGVAQRSRLWQKNLKIFPHVLVMTATPIPRTLAMTVYGDLSVSVIDELPPGRKPVTTRHFREGGRLKLFRQMEEEIEKGRQVYVVYPLIEESEKLDYNHLMDGYTSIQRRFPKYHLSVVHGRMKAEAKEWEMQRFLRKETQIMVATTVIEVGVDVPNASVMVIESAERFGLSQLHQLRGRVGRGGEQSHCFLMTGDKLSAEALTRLETMVRTNDGFEIAETDLRLRGPGDLMGTQQSGLLNLKVADLVKDNEILKHARLAAQVILKADPELKTTDHRPLKRYLENRASKALNWSQIS